MLSEIELPYGIQDITHRYLHSHIHCSIIHKSQDWKQPKCSPAPLRGRARGSDAVTGCRRAVLWVRVAEWIWVAVYPVVGL